jgi:hypothetical protein
LERKLYRRAEVPQSVDAKKSPPHFKAATAGNLNAIQIKGSPQLHRVKVQHGATPAAKARDAYPGDIPVFRTPSFASWTFAGA